MGSYGQLLSSQLQALRSSTAIGLHPFWAGTHRTGDNPNRRKQESKSILQQEEKNHFASIFASDQVKQTPDEASPTTQSTQSAPRRGETLLERHEAEVRSRLDAERGERKDGTRRWGGWLVEVFWIGAQNGNRGRAP